MSHFLKQEAEIQRGQDSLVDKRQTGPTRIICLFIQFFQCSICFDDNPFTFSQALLKVVFKISLLEHVGKGQVADLF